MTSLAEVVPHSWIYLEVKDAKGEPQMWAMEATGRTGLQKVGITPDYVKPGDQVKARCHHLRDGSNGCLLGFLKAKDGSVKDWDGNNAPARLISKTDSACRDKKQSWKRQKHGTVG